MIKEAPIFFFLVCTLASVILHFYFKRKYRERLAAKDETIEHKNEFITYYKEKMEWLTAGNTATQIPAALIAAGSEPEPELVAIRDSLASLQEKLSNPPEHILVFEVDTEAFRSLVKLDRFDDNDDGVDDPTTRTYVLEADLRIRFKNGAADPRGVTALEFSIVTTSGSEEPLTEYMQPLTIQHPGDEKTQFVILRVIDSDTTAWYAFVFSVLVPTKCALSLDRNSFLRITMKATRQEPVSFDYAAPWKRAYGEQVSLSLRREGSI